jgi:replicative DNA helicase
MSALAVRQSQVIDVKAEPASETPPFDLEAEAAVLTAVMLDPTAILKVVDFLRPEHFYSEAHRWAFAAVVDLHAKGSPIDSLHVRSWLRDRQRIAQVGGATAILGMLDASPAVANVRSHALIVHDKWRARLVIEACHRISAVGYGDYGETQTFCDRAARTMLDIAQRSAVGRTETNKEALGRIAKRMAEASEALRLGAAEQRRPARGIPTQIHSYDRLMCGLHAGHKTTIAAHPGVGKTALAMQIGWTVAERGVGVIVFSTEMSRDELLMREVSRRAEIPFGRLRAGELSSDQWSKFTKAASFMADLPLVIDDTSDINIDQVKASARGYADQMLATHKAPLGVAILDYVQNLRAAPDVVRAMRHEQLEHATKGFKAIVKDLGIAGIELAQRKPTEIDPKRKTHPKPTKGCCAGTSEIEKCADEVVYIHRNPREDHTGAIVGEDPKSVVFVITKHRGGEEGEIEMRFRGEYARFEDPNAPSVGSNPSRQYVDDGSTTLTDGL